MLCLGGRDVFYLYKSKRYKYGLQIALNILININNQNKILIGIVENE